MILIGIALLVLGTLLLPLAWRGRISARGQFCKKCTFDLAGSPIDTEGNKCPECGEPIHTQSSRRTTLRKSSRLGLVIAIAFMAIGITTLWIGSSGKTGILLGFLPDSTILWLSEHGTDEAIDELAVRITSTTNPIPSEFHIKAIEFALAHQADTSQPWNPRWGEVLSLSFGNPIMTDDQMKQYVRNGTEMSARIRSRVRQGADEVDLIVTTSPGRISATNFNETGYWIHTKLIRGGVVGGKPRKFYGNDQQMHNFWIPKQGSRSASPYRNTIKPFGTGFDEEPGSQVQVYVEYELVIRGLGVVGEYRTEQSVLVLDPEESIVPSFTDQAMAQQLCESISVSPVRLAKEIEKPTSNFGLAILELRMRFESIPASIAMRTFLRFDDGELVEFGKWVQQGPPSNMKGSSTHWPMNPYDMKVYTYAKPYLERIIEQGHIDIIFKPDPSLAINNPQIIRVLDTTLVFENLPIQLIEDSTKVMAMPPDVKKMQWITGACSIGSSADSEMGSAEDD